jgi:hypothetical protein
MPEAVEPRGQPADLELNAYLGRLEATLDLPVDERADVREEIWAHLLEERATLTAAGMDLTTATTGAIHRLGDPVILGRELTSARRSGRSLLAVAGAGTWAAAGAAVRGWVIGLALLVVVLGVGSVVIAIANRIGRIGGWSIMDQGWFTALGVTTLWFAAWGGARTFVSVAARDAHRRAERVRPWVAGLGGLAVAWLALVWLRGPQNLFSVLMLGLVPVLFGVAALTGSDRPIARSRGARRASLALFATAIVGVPLLLLAAVTPVTTGLSAVGSGPYASMEDLLLAQGFDLPGRFVADPPDFGGLSWSNSNGVAEVTLSNVTATTTDRWHGLRVEAWRAVLSTGSLDRAYNVPFATAPMTVTADQSLVGSVRVDRVRDVSEFWLVVTGVAADGRRDLVASLGGTNTTFTGSALDWLTAP